jgi:hypothetical protein
MKKKTAATNEGSMVQLTRWMVKTYLPGHSIYKTRDVKKIERVEKYRRPSKKATDAAFARAQAEFKMRTESVPTPLQLDLPYQNDDVVQAPESLNPDITTETTTASNPFISPVVESEVKS